MESSNLKYNYKTLSQSQGSLLTRSFLVTGISFLLICLIGYGFGVLFNKMVFEWGKADAVNSLYMISVLIIFISIFGSMIVMRNLLSQQTWKIAMWIGLYCIGEGIGVGMLFALFANDTYTLVLLFGVCGALFITCSLIGKILTANGAFKLIKFLSYCMIAMFVLMILMFIPMILMINGASILSFRWYYWLILGLSCIFFMGYIAYDVFLISKTSQFVALEDNRAQTNLVLYFGYKLLIDLMGLFWTLANLLSYSRR